jgi:hypothetical protein
MMAADGIEVLPEDRFDSYRLQVGNIRGLHGRILARADDSGRLTGDWKVVIGSSAKIRAAFKAPQLYTAPDLASFEFLLEAEAAPSHLEPTRRSATGLTSTYASASGSSPSCAAPASTTKRPDSWPL